jgi:YegS/Rv2252/BmrU family lipid kinase
MAASGKIWIILNPIAGKGKAAKLYPKIESILKGLGENFEFLLTKKPGDAIEIVRNLPLGDDDISVAAGGDGTCNEVANGLLTRGKPLSLPPIMGILPIGRGNDFSSTPGIPGKYEKAVEVLVQRKTRPLDAGFVKGGFFPEGRYFINGVGIGFDTQVGFDAAKMKHVHSGFAYALGAIVNIVNYKPSPILQIKYDEKEATLPAVIVSIMNGRRMGGSFFMGPKALLDDGALDICYLRHPKGRIRLIQLVLRYTKGTQGECEETTMSRATHFHLQALEGGMAAHCDGETICYDGKELEITCKPGALRLVGV